MPLPISDPKTVWPPKALDTILPSMLRWSALYSNDLERMQIAFGGGTPNDTTGFFASDAGGRKVHSLGPIRWFVGEAPLGNARNTKLPIPLAAEMCQASADLLFSDKVTITVGKADDPAKTTEGADKKPLQANPTQERLDVLLDDSFYSTIAEAAELCAALGGTYLRVTWDDATHPDGPFSTTLDADTAIPEFRFGRLVAVTFWSVIHRDGKYVYRHLERHELDDRGYGVILHGLYEGEEATLGARVALTARPETSPLAMHADLALVQGTIDTKSVGLAVQYVPNQTPNRMWRADPLGRNLGRSDLDGVEHLLDQLAETMSDWMRARRAARARVMLSKDLVKSAGPGNGTSADLDRETYVDTAFAGGTGPSASPSLADRVQVLQPDFKPEQYKATADSLIEQILQMAGYSMQTFGVQPEKGTGDKTATEIESKERRSLMTRARKIREWQPALCEHITKLLAVDRDFFSHPNVVSDIEIEFADGVQESQIKLGQFVQSLYNAESASMRERVAILHDEWDDDQIDAEVEAIKTEFGHDLATPAMSPFDNTPASDPAVK